MIDTAYQTALRDLAVDHGVTGEDTRRGDVARYRLCTALADDRAKIAALAAGVAIGTHLIRRYRNR